MNPAPRIQLIKADITTLQVDAIVNAANQTLLGGGGVDGAIHRAAGPQLLNECKNLPEIRSNVRCPTGEAKITKAYNLPATYVIHTVGPVWHGGTHNEESLLKNCYINSLKLATENNIKTIAFPSISTGVYHYPFKTAATLAYHTIQDYLENHQSPETVILVTHSQQDYNDYQEIIKTQD